MKNLLKLIICLITFYPLPVSPQAANTQALERQIATLKMTMQMTTDMNKKTIENFDNLLKKAEADLATEKTTTAKLTQENTRLTQENVKLTNSLNEQKTKTVESKLKSVDPTIEDNLKIIKNRITTTSVPNINNATARTNSIITYAKAIKSTPQAAVGIADQILTEANAVQQLITTVSTELTSMK